MLGLSVVKYKRELMQAFSECFLPVKDSLGNVPVLMQQSKFITASILGICRGYSESRVKDESDFDLIVDAVFEEIFRRESVEVQTRTESWLQSSDDEFMFFYFQAKYRTMDSENLNWLQNTLLNSYEPAHTVVFPL